MAILLRHLNEPIPAVSSLDPSVDRGISDWIERLLVKDPTQRVRSAADAWDELEELIIALVGPRWRRSARLSAPDDEAGEGRPLTPAPFETTAADGASPPLGSAGPR